MSFEEYLERALSKEPSLHYDPEGSSPRAVIVRGRWKHLVKTYKGYYPYLYRALKENWSGWDTELGYIFQAALVPFLFPVLPLITSELEYIRAVKAYRKSYEEDH